MAGGASQSYFKLSDAQRVAWLRLIRTENVGPATFRDLINQCGSADNALDVIPELLNRSGKKRYLQTPSVSEAEDEIAAIHALGGDLVGIGEAAYPPNLRSADMPPPLVTIKGNPAIFQMPSVSIVGSRNASMAGIRMTRNLATELGAAGHAIVSGLARGIDKAGHEASLQTGTIACLAGGIDKPYPPENLDLLARIEKDGMGASISEMPLGWEPRARDFPRRNRIIAGLSMGLVVVEAATRSGSLISARLAAEMGRAVFAVPGSPLDPRSQGTNKLIRNGATLVTCGQDILDDIGPMAGNTGAGIQSQGLLLETDEPMALPPDDSDRARVMELLSPTPTSIDDIIEHTGLSTGQVMLILLEATLDGRIERHSGNRASLV